MSLPIIHLNGNLGHDAQLRYTATGTPVLNFNVACSGYVGSGERRREHVDWYRCALFGKRAEGLASTLLKGTRVSLVGRVLHQAYSRNDGSAGCALEVTVLALDLGGTPHLSGIDAGAEAVVAFDGEG